MKSGVIAAIVGLAATLTGACAVGPRYVVPPVPVPAGYKEAEVSGADLLRPAAPDDQAPRQGWWELFHDQRLNELEARLQQGNVTIAEAAARVDQARAVLRQDKALYAPVVTGTASATRARSSAVTGQHPAAQTVNDLNIGASATWEPDLWGRIRQTVASGTAAAQAAIGDRESIGLSASAELAADYFQLRAFDSELSLLDRTIEAYGRAATLTRNQYDAGVVSRADVEQAETQLEAVRADAIDVRLQRAQTEHAIAALLGTPPADLTLEALPLVGTPPAVPADLPSRILERRPDVAAAERRVAAANAQVGIASTAFFPTVTLGASGGFLASHLQQWLSWPVGVWSVGPALAATLLDGGARKAAKAQAVATYDETVAAYRGTVISAFQDVEDNLAAQHLLAGEAELRTAAVAAAQRSLDIATNQYRAGVVSYLQVTTAQTALLDNQRTAVSLDARRFVAAVQLVRALGGGWSGSMSLN
jgi:NodT family efflux transporter outer membrane factor (OMF) lipoprotein